MGNGMQAILAGSYQRVMLTGAVKPADWLIQLFLGGEHEKKKKREG